MWFNVCDYEQFSAHFLKENLVRGLFNATQNDTTATAVKDPLEFLPQKSRQCAVFDAFTFARLLQSIAWALRRFTG
jgi:hypothetical protein